MKKSITSNFSVSIGAVAVFSAVGNSPIYLLINNSTFTLFYQTLQQLTKSITRGKIMPFWADFLGFSEVIDFLAPTQNERRK